MLGPGGEEESGILSAEMTMRSGSVIYDDDPGAIVRNADPGAALEMTRAASIAKDDVHREAKCRHLSPEITSVASIARNGGLVHIAGSDEGISYPGGKGNLFQKLINLIPPHRVYIEPFVGGGAVLRNKRPARGSIAIDTDASALDMVRSTIAIDDGNTWLFLNLDAIEWLRSYSFQGDEFIYADPPYVMSSRRQHRRLYRYELSDKQHKQLLTILVKVPCKVMISGYWSKLYEKALAGWHVETFDVMTRGGSWAKEYVWMNYSEPLELHDYSFLGDDFRERERIKRKINRWVKRLEKMPILERRAMLGAIAKFSDPAGHKINSNNSERTK